MKGHLGIVCKAALTGLTLAAATTPTTAGEEPFKQTNIHFETNATACDMGIQISFDTDGVTRGSIEDPHEKVVFSFGAVDGMAVTQDITEVFQERVEPPIIDLQSALGCEPSNDAISLTELLPPGPPGGTNSKARATAWNSKANQGSRTKYPRARKLPHRPMAPSSRTTRRCWLPGRK